jgi:hypothetical protein
MIKLQLWMNLKVENIKRYILTSKIKENNGFAGGSQNYISDDKIWEFFDELLNLRNHLGTKVLINFRSTHGGWYCNISYLVGRY